MKIATLVISLALLAACGEKQVAAPPPAQLASADEIIANSSCLSCHQPGNQMKLPTWSAIAKRYKDNKDAENILTSKIAKGGSGNWGKMDMPPYHPDLSEAERKIVIQQILSTPQP